MLACTLPPPSFDYLFGWLVGFVSPSIHSNVICLWEICKLLSTSTKIVLLSLICASIRFLDGKSGSLAYWNYNEIKMALITFQKIFSLKFGDWVYDAGSYLNDWQVSTLPLGFLATAKDERTDKWIRLTNRARQKQLPALVTEIHMSKELREEQWTPPLPS